MTAAYVDQDGDGSERFVLGDFDAEGKQFSVGLGAHWAISDSIDIVGTVSCVDVEVEIDVPGFGSVSADDDGIGLGVGLRGKAGEAIELEGGLQTTPSVHPQPQILSVAFYGVKITDTPAIPLYQSNRQGIERTCLLWLP